MKQILKVSIVAIAMALLMPFRNTASAQVSAGISFQVFYDNLSPYGHWIDYPEYGYVWNPNVGSGFRPYSTMGHWEWSDEYEWIWVSDYDWGWAPFHYGRWFFDPAYGWLWMPGYDWSPAWVAWRGGGDYYGWAPLRPGISINISIGSYAPPVDYWCFAPRRYITSRRIYDYCVSPRMNVNIIHNTTIINNYNFYGSRSRNVFVNGPRRSEVERYTHERIRSVSFRDSDRPGRTDFRNNSITMYRPNVEKNDNNQFAPRSFSRYNTTPQQNERWERSDNAFNRHNNLPGQKETNNNNPIKPENDNTGWPGRKDRNPGEERTNNLPQRNNQDQANPFGQRQRQDQNTGQNSDRRKFQDRSNNQNNNNNNSDRSFKPFEKRQQPTQDNSRTNERRSWGDQNNSQQRKIEEPRKFERRDNGSRDRGNRNFGRTGRSERRQG